MKNHRQIFNEEFILPFLTKLTVKTDIERIRDVSPSLIIINTILIIKKSMPQ